MTDELRPDRIWIGESPDYDGVVIILDPQTENQVIVVIGAQAAVKAGQRLYASGIDRLERARTIEASITTPRDRPLRLDS
jgi:hypothetical protein